jgi:biotin carboxyl carrier protein
VTPSIASIESIEHPALATIVSPVRGEIASAPRAGRRVARGDVLFEVRRRRGGGGSRELAARVAELERLARQDPVYEAFLARARAEQRRAQRGDRIIAVRAAAAGEATPSVARGDQVASGDTLAVISDPATWIVRASLSAPATRDWHCALTADGNRAPCRIDQILTDKDGAHITVSLEASAAPWLADDSKPRLVLTP